MFPDVIHYGTGALYPKREKKSKAELAESEHRNLGFKKIF